MASNRYKKLPVLEKFKFKQEDSPTSKNIDSTNTQAEPPKKAPPPPVPSRNLKKVEEEVPKSENSDSTNTQAEPLNKPVPQVPAKLRLDKGRKDLLASESIFSIESDGIKTYSDIEKINTLKDPEEKMVAILESLEWLESLFARMILDKSFPNGATAKEICEQTAAQAGREEAAKLEKEEGTEEKAEKNFQLTKEQNHIQRKIARMQKCYLQVTKTLIGTNLTEEQKNTVKEKLVHISKNGASLLDYSSQKWDFQEDVYSRKEVTKVLVELKILQTGEEAQIVQTAPTAPSKQMK